MWSSEICEFVISMQLQWYCASKQIQGYKIFQEKCTETEEMIDIMLQNVFGDKFKKEKAEETNML